MTRAPIPQSARRDSSCPSGESQAGISFDLAVLRGWAKAGAWRRHSPLRPPADWHAAARVYAGCQAWPHGQGQRPAAEPAAMPTAPGPRRIHAWPLRAAQPVLLLDAGPGCRREQTASAWALRQACASRASSLRHAAGLRETTNRVAGLLRLESFPVLRGGSRALEEKRVLRGCESGDPTGLVIPAKRPSASRRGGGSKGSVPLFPPRSRC